MRSTTTRCPSGWPAVPAPAAGTGPGPRAHRAGLVTDQVQSRTILQSIRDLGIAVSIDDYGTATPPGLPAQPARRRTEARPHLHHRSRHRSHRQRDHPHHRRPRPLPRAAARRRGHRGRQGRHPSRRPRLRPRTGLPPRLPDARPPGADLAGEAHRGSADTLPRTRLSAVPPGHTAGRRDGARSVTRGSAPRTWSAGTRRVPRARSSDRTRTPSSLRAVPPGRAAPTR